MKIKTIRISDINPAPYNPRIDLKPGDPDYEKLKNSIKTFGYLEPLVYNERTKTLISGHQRLKIFIEQSVTEVECSVVDFSLEQEKACNIALNKISGDWDEAKLAELLTSLQDVPNFDVNLTGFEPTEISELLDNNLNSKQEDSFDFEACVGVIKEPITKEGDIIELSSHRILCGDALNPEHIKLLLGQEKINLLHTDPPYNVSYYGGNRPHAHARPKKHRRHDSR